MPQGNHEGLPLRGREETRWLEGEGEVVYEAGVSYLDG